MPRALHIAILRNAALLVPAPERGEWLAEWKAELYYVGHDATAFCLGSFRDALWLRRKSFSVRRMFSLDSPLSCVLLLAALGSFDRLAGSTFSRTAAALMVVAGSRADRSGTPPDVSSALAHPADAQPADAWRVSGKSPCALADNQAAPMGLPCYQNRTGCADFPVRVSCPSADISTRTVDTILWPGFRAPLGLDGSAPALPRLPPLAHESHQNRQPYAKHSWMVRYRTHLHPWPRIALRSGRAHKLVLHATLAISRSHLEQSALLKSSFLCAIYYLVMRYEQGIPAMHPRPFRWSFRSV